MLYNLINSSKKTPVFLNPTFLHWEKSEKRIGYFLLEITKLPTYNKAYGMLLKDSIQRAEDLFKLLNIGNVNVGLEVNIQLWYNNNN